MRKDAFVLSETEKIERISESVRDIMLTLGLDLEDDSLKGTPNRVAKMYVKDDFSRIEAITADNPTIMIMNDRGTFTYVPAENKAIKLIIVNVFLCYVR